MTEKQLYRRWSEERFKEAILKRKEDGLSIKPREIGKEDRGLYEAIKRRYGSFERMYEELGLDVEIRKTMKWTESKIQEAIFKRKEAGLSLRPKDVLKDDSKLHAAIMKYFGNFGNMSKELGYEKEIKKVRSEEKKVWTEDKIKEAILKRKEEGLSLRPGRINSECGGLYKEINRHYGSCKKLYEQLGIDVDVRVHQEWTSEKIKEVIFKRKEAGKSLSPGKIKEEASGLYRAIRRTYGSCAKLYEQLGIEVATQPEWSKEKIKEAIFKRKEEGLSIRPGRINKEDRGLYMAIRRNYGSCERLYEELGLEEEILKYTKWTKAVIREEVMKRIEEGRSIEPREIKKEDEKLHSAIYRHYGNFKNMCEELGL